MGELLFLGVLLLGSGYFYYLTFSFRVYYLDKSGGAGIFPRIVLIFLCIFLIIRIITVIKNKKEPFVFFELFRGMRLFFLLSIVAYIMLLQFLGYQITTIAFLIVTVNVFYFKTKGVFGKLPELLVRNAAIAVFVVALNQFFAGILKVYLPAGYLASLF